MTYHLASGRVAGAEVGGHVRGVGAAEGNEAGSGAGEEGSGD